MMLPTVPTVASAFKLPRGRLTNGELGIEIEVEGGRVDDVGEYWETVRDHSLRGGREYVLNSPLSVEDSKKALSLFDKRVVEDKVTFNDSVRAAVHVHVNVQKMTMVQMFNFVTLYMSFEEVLTGQCGNGRQGNLFCLRSCDAEYLPMYIANVIDRQSWSDFGNDDIRYSAINLKALTTYGSLEFRALRTPPSSQVKERVWKWIELLLALRDAAYTFDNPIEVLSGFSGDGCGNFLEKIFRENAGLLFSVDGWEDKMVSGMRNAQDVAYATNWDHLLKEAPMNPWAASKVG